MFYDLLFVFFFKQKTAYEMRISDWSSDVCSSDLKIFHGYGGPHGTRLFPILAGCMHGPAGLQRDAERHESKGRRSSTGKIRLEIGRASCRERVCQYV